MSEQSENTAAQRTEKRKAQGRAASQRHRFAQRAKGIPEAREIDTTIAAYLIGRVLDGEFHIPANAVRPSSRTSSRPAVGTRTVKRSSRSFGAAALCC